MFESQVLFMSGQVYSEELPDGRSGDGDGDVRLELEVHKSQMRSSAASIHRSNTLRLLKGRNKAS